MKNKREPILAALLGDREAVVYRPLLARALGSPTAALYLCQALYWQQIQGVGNWWYKLRDAERNSAGEIVPPSHPSRQSWEWELGLSRSEQESARKLLRHFSLLEERKAGIPARLYYRVNCERLEAFLLANQDRGQVHRGGNCQPDGSNQPTGHLNVVVKPEPGAPSNTETTSEITSMTTTTTLLQDQGSGSRGTLYSSKTLIFEKSIATLSEQLTEILHAANIVDATIAQSLLDELAGTIEAAGRGDRMKIASTPPWFRKLVTRATEGKFDQVYCKTIQARRLQRAREMEQRTCEIQRSAASSNVANEHLSRIRETMRRKR